MAKVNQISNAKPKVDRTKKVRADRRLAFLDALAVRWGLLDWGAFQVWARECAEKPTTDQGVNEQAREMLLKLAGNIPVGDPNIPPADMDKVRELYPVKGKRQSVSDEAGRLAVRPKAETIFTKENLAHARDSQEQVWEDFDRPSAD